MSIELHCVKSDNEGKIYIIVKKMLTNALRGAIILLPLIEGSFFVPCQTGAKMTPEEGTGGLVAKFTDEVRKYRITGGTEQ